MKIKLILLYMFFRVLSLTAQSVEIELPGTLNTRLSEEEKRTLTSLQVKGPINTSDIATLKAMPLLAHIDLSQVTAIDAENDIPHGAFSGNKVITSIVLPACVRDIAYTSFSDCSNLKQIDFSRCINLRNIGGGSSSASNGAFKGCTSLLALDFRGCTSLRYIGIYDFSNCTSLSSVDLSGCIALEHLDGSFSGCTSLQSVNLQGCTSLAVIDGNSMYRGTFEKCSALRSVNLNGCTALTTINNQAFSNCIALEEIDLSPCTKLQTIDASFSQCTSLRKVTLPNSCTAFKYNVFHGCIQLADINLPNSLKEIGEKAFLGCKALQEVVIPHGVTTMGNSAFEQCTALRKVSIPSTVSIWGESIFKLCSQLSDVTLCEGLLDLGPYMFEKCTSLQTIQLPQSLKAVRGFAGSSSNSGCAIQSIVIPDGVETIAANAFKDCRSLSQVTMGKSVSSIECDAFSGCTSLVSIQLPANLVSLHIGAFSNCSSLQSLVISPDNPSFSTSEGVLFNKNQTELLYVPLAKSGAYSLPGTLTRIGSEQFYKRDQITSLEFPEGVVEIDVSAIRYCANLTSITLPASLKTFGTRFLHENGKLITLRLKSTEIPDWKLIWYFIPPQASIYIPQGTLALYLQHPDWSLYETYFKEESGPTSIDQVQEPINSIWFDNGNLIFENANQESFVEIYTLGGTLLFKGQCKSATSVQLPRESLLMVKIDGTIHKVVNR